MRRAKEANEQARQDAAQGMGEDDFDFSGLGGMGAGGGMGGMGANLFNLLNDPELMTAFKVFYLLSDYQPIQKKCY